MMAAVFTLLALALLFGWFGRRDIALVFIIFFLVVALKEFLWEIHSSSYGYRMPWLQTRFMKAPPVAPHLTADHRLIIQGALA
ncbi:hypothetical protein [Phyllobacterium leguminum]|uniref:Uncharacterized protein n=1 Tax=Phyllobacterium leguminum TaxID=314237 RepID=A0A318TE35_9HYPH|nr:hypothetical protein [Phyllobacterium leguminum]PYE86650.1 hypothetical protein C7477_12115 [Phyllobacterium leguminum]